MTGVIHAINEAKGMQSEHREHGMVIGVGMSGQYGAGGMVLDSKMMYGSAILIALLVGGAVGYFFPEYWRISPRVSSMDRAAQVVGAFCWAINYVQLLEWFRRIFLYGLAILIICLSVTIPYQYIANGKLALEPILGVPVLTLTLLIKAPEMLLQKWKVSQLDRRVAPEIRPGNETTPANLAKFDGMWIKDGDPLSFKDISASSGSVSYSWGQKNRVEKIKAYGNGLIIRSDHPQSEYRGAFRFVDKDTIEVVSTLGYEVDVVSTLHRIDRKKGYQEVKRLRDEWEKLHGAKYRADRARMLKLIGGE